MGTRGKFFPITINLPYNRLADMMKKKVKIGGKVMLKMEQEMIPFSTMADLASTMELDLRKSDCLQKTVRRGARFIQNLSKQLVSPGQGHISKNMDKASLMD